MMKDKDLTAYCGLYCGDCIRYRCKASDLADKLLNEIDKHHFMEYANIKRTHIKEFENFESLVTSLHGKTWRKYSDLHLVLLNQVLLKFRVT